MDSYYALLYIRVGSGTERSREVMPPKHKNSIPDRWTDYKAVGKRIPGTRFIAFKVPLKQSLRRRVSEEEAFGPFDLLEVLKKEGEELGLIIDLTYTTRYYQPQDLPDCLRHLKIFTAGHEIPKDSTILSFKRAVRKFLCDNHDNDKLIGVHCTHGLNRTGYLICRYLIDVDGIKPSDAIDLFNRSRGHAIERQNYLDDLTSGQKRSNDGMEEPEQEPVQGGAMNRKRDFTHSQADADRHSHYRSWNHPERPHPPALLATPLYYAPPPHFVPRPPLLPTPPYRGAWPGFRAGHYPAPNPAFMRRYRFREETTHTAEKVRRTDYTH